MNLILFTEYSSCIAQNNSENFILNEETLCIKCQCNFHVITEVHPCSKPSFLEGLVTTALTQEFVKLVFDNCLW